MILHPTPLPGVHVVELKPFDDERGFFARAFSSEIFAAHGIPFGTVNANLSFNHLSGTLRGMHYQVAPALEPKLVRCIHGRIWDVAVDLRPDSPTYLRHFGVELNDQNRLALCLPPLCAHGYLTLSDHAEVLYLTGAEHCPSCERGLRYDDPALAIAWPAEPRVLSAKDQAWPAFQPDSQLQSCP